MEKLIRALETWGAAADAVSIFHDCRCIHSRSEDDQHRCGLAALSDALDKAREAVFAAAKEGGHVRRLDLLLGEDWEDDAERISALTRLLKMAAHSATKVAA